MSAFTVIRGDDLNSRFFVQFELVGFPGAAWTDKPLPFRSTGNILNVCTIAIVPSFLQEVLRTAVGTFNKKPCCLHLEPDGLSRFPLCLAATV
jgi:hypothetical protein